MGLGIVLSQQGRQTGPEFVNVRYWPRCEAPRAPQNVCC